MPEALNFITDLPRLSTRIYRTRDEEYQFSPDGTLLLIWRTYPAAPHEGPAGQVLLAETGECLSTILPLMDPAKLQQKWMLYEVAWDETGLHRVALWWRFEGTEVHEVEGDEDEGWTTTLDESVIQVFDARSGESLWAMDAGPGRTTFSNNRHLFLFGDTLRLIYEEYIEQYHRSGLSSCWKRRSYGKMALADGSGELQYLDPLPVGEPFLAEEPPPVEETPADEEPFPLVSPSGRHVIFGARLYEITDRPRDRVALPSLCFPPARRMIEVSQDLPPGEVSSKVDLSALRWSSAGYGEQPVETHAAAEPLTCTLDDVRRVLEAQGWPISGVGAWRTACERSRSLVVAEVLERPEGAVAFMTAWRNLWPVRWKVPLQGNAEAAAGQIMQALLTGHERLTRMPLPYQTKREFDPTEFSLSLEDLRNLKRTLSGDEANLAKVAQFRLQWESACMFLALPPPPEPDWNLVRLCWYEGSLPLWVLRQLWTWMPADDRTELRKDLEAGELDLDLEFEAWLKSERAQQLS